MTGPGPGDPPRTGPQGPETGPVPRDVRGASDPGPRLYSLFPSPPESPRTHDLTTPMRRITPLVLGLLVPLAAARPTVRPTLQDGEEPALPRYLTAEEARLLESQPITVPARAVTPPPSGPLHCVAEYEPMDALLVAWEGSGSWTSILAQMAAQVTTVGDADVLVAVDSAAEGASATSAIAAQGADMARVRTMVVTTDSIWIRDYGPRFVYQGAVRSMVDHTYNRPRPNDDVFPVFFSSFAKKPRYELGLVHGGGNFHLDALDRSYVTRLIVNENPSLSELQIHDIWLDYENVDTTFFNPLPQNVDSTQHIDMWMQVVADDVVVISDWPAQSGTIQDQICDTAAVLMAARGYTVFRTPARNLSGTHYTYTNVVMCNDLVLLPRYTNTTISPYNAQALAAWQQACPTKSIVQVNCQSIVSAAGVMHCIVMHVPRHLGGAEPTAYVVRPDGGEVLQGGTGATIEWISDDDVAVTSVELRLSLDGGQSFPTTIATGLPPNGSFAWTTPSLSSSRARVRAVARDADGHQGSDDSDADFVLDGPGALAGLAPYGAGKAGTLGVPQLDASGLPVLGVPLALELSDALPGGTAGFLFGVAPAAIPFDGATILVSSLGVLNLPISPGGGASLPLTVPASTGLAGLSLYWQVWIPGDAAAAGMGWAASQGLETVLGY